MAPNPVIRKTINPLPSSNLSSSTPASKEKNELKSSMETEYDSYSQPPATLTPANVVPSSTATDASPNSQAHVSSPLLRSLATSSNSGFLLGTQEGDNTSYNQGNLTLSPSSIRLSPSVEKFILDFHDEIYRGNLEGIRRVYENDFNQVSEQWFVEERWPSVDEIEQFLIQVKRNHLLILTLYSQLYYRHAFVNSSDTITWKDRKDSWYHYSRLLTHFIQGELQNKTKENNERALKLTSQWVWDLLDEFIYQYQSTMFWKVSKCAKTLPEQKTELAQTLAMYQQDQEVWSTTQVLEFLHLIIEKSKIHQYMAHSKEDFSRSSVADIELRYQLGYFAIIALIHLQVLLGNYQLAMKIASDLDLSSKAYYWKVPAAHISLFYHLGFTLMMLRRYNDAIRFMSQLLVFVSKQQYYISTQSYQQAAMTNMIERMYMLILICNSVVNTRLDDGIAQTLKEKYSTQMYELQQDNEVVYRHLFFRAAPKPINPASPSFDSRESLLKASSKVLETRDRLANVLLREIAFSKKVNKVNSFAKLYNTVSLQKLASLMDLKEKDSEEAVRSEMLCVKHKSRQKVSRGTSLSVTEFVQMSPDVDFYLDGSIVEVKNEKVKKIHVNHFIKQINRCQDLLNVIYSNNQPINANRSNYTTNSMTSNASHSHHYRSYPNSDLSMTSSAMGVGSVSTRSSVGPKY